VIFSKLKITCFLIRIAKITKMKINKWTRQIFPSKLILTTYYFIKFKNKKNRNLKEKLKLHILQKLFNNKI